MTHPTRLSESVMGQAFVDEGDITPPALYGDGNIGSAFMRFPNEHQCNRYCHWAELSCPSHDEISFLTAMDLGTQTSQ
jgi:hypothetical protein